MYVDVYKLTDEVLASVSEAETEKVAEDTTSSMNTEVGSLLKNAADTLRHQTDEITYADLNGEPPAVKTAAFTEVTGSTDLSRSLREVANVIRQGGISKSAAKRENSDRIIRAAMGLSALTGDSR